MSIVNTSSSGSSSVLLQLGSGGAAPAQGLSGSSGTTDFNVLLNSANGAAGPVDVQTLLAGLEAQGADPRLLARLQALAEQSGALTGQVGKGVPADGSGLPLLGDYPSLSESELLADATPILVDGAAVPVVASVATGPGLLSGQAASSDTGVSEALARSAGLAEQALGGATGGTRQQNGDGQPQSQSQSQTLLGADAQSSAATTTVGRQGVFNLQALQQQLGLAVDADAIADDSSDALKSVEERAPQQTQTLTWAATTQGPVSYRVVGGEVIASSAVSTPVGQSGWGEQVANQVAWFSARNVSSAEIQLDPPELGPLQVRISATQDQGTTVNFNSQHASVRDALDQSLPRLREMFSEQGLDLADVDVSGQSAGDGTGDDNRGEGVAGQAGDDGLGDGTEGDADINQTTVATQVKQGLVDDYA